MFSDVDNKCFYSIKNNWQRQLCQKSAKFIPVHMNYIYIKTLISVSVSPTITTPAFITLTFYSMTSHLYFYVVLMTLMFLTFSEMRQVGWINKRFLKRIDTKTIKSIENGNEESFSRRWKYRKILKRIDSNVKFIKKKLGRACK